MYASAVRSFRIQGKLPISGHVSRWSSKDGCFQDAADALMEQHIFRPECRRTCQSIAVRIGEGQANPPRLLLDTLKRIISLH
jgi:hypothetical protein